MRKALKIIIPIVIAVPVIFILVAVLSMPIINTNPDEIAGITQFVIIDDGSMYKVRFSLVDNQDYAAASDGKLDMKVYNRYETQLYRYEFDVKASEFQQYQLVLTGQPIHAYAFNVEEDLGSGDGPNTAVLTYTLPNGKSFTADTSVF